MPWFVGRMYCPPGSILESVFLWRVSVDSNLLVWFSCFLILISFVFCLCSLPFACLSDHAFVYLLFNVVSPVWFSFLFLFSLLPFIGCLCFLVVVPCDFYLSLSFVLPLFPDIFQRAVNNSGGALQI